MVSHSHFLKNKDLKQPEADTTLRTMSLPATVSSREVRRFDILLVFTSVLFKFFSWELIQIYFKNVI